MKEINHAKFEPIKLSKDPSITKKGVSQCQGLAEDLIPLIGDLKVILVSPMQRTLQTLGYALENLVE